jgi:hypothetical protein
MFSMRMVIYLQGFTCGGTVGKPVRRFGGDRWTTTYTHSFLISIYETRLYAARRHVAIAVLVRSMTIEIRLVQHAPRTLFIFQSAEQETCVFGLNDFGKATQTCGCCLPDFDKEREVV